MKRLFFLFLFSGLLLWGCSESGKPVSKEKKYAKEEQRTNYENDVDTRIKAYKVDVVEMKLKKDKLNQKEQEELSAQIEKIENRIADIEKDMNNLKSTMDSSWIQLKTGIDEQLSRLDVEVDSTRINYNLE